MASRKVDLVVDAIMRVSLVKECIGYILVSLGLCVYNDWYWLQAYRIERKKNIQKKMFRKIGLCVCRDLPRGGQDIYPLRTGIVP